MAAEVRAEVLLPPVLPAAGHTPGRRLHPGHCCGKNLESSPNSSGRALKRAARESGLALDLSLQPKMYPTDAAHTLLRHAHAKGTQPALASAFFRSYFLDAKNIGDETVLADIAAQHGFTRTEALELATSKAELELTRDEATSAVQGGIRGVPFFVFDGRLAISGAQSVSVLQAAIREALVQTTPSDPPPAP